MRDNWFASGLVIASLIAAGIMIHFRVNSALYAALVFVDAIGLGAILWVETGSIAMFFFMVGIGIPLTIGAWWGMPRYYRYLDGKR